MSERSVADIMDELEEENQILLNDLLFERQLNAILEDIRKYALILVNDCECDENSDYKEKINQLNTDYDVLTFRKLVNDKAVHSFAEICANSDLMFPYSSPEHYSKGRQKNYSENCLTNNDINWDLIFPQELSAEKSVPDMILELLDSEPNPDLITLLTSLNLYSDKSLEEFVDLFYKKAVTEPELSGKYVQVLHRIANICTILFKDKSGENQTFRDLFINKCLDGLGVKRLEEWTRRELFECTEGDIIETLIEVEKKEVKTMLANVRLFVELYKQCMVRTYDVIKYMEELMYVASDESMECLAMLLAVCGHHIEHETNYYYEFKSNLNQCFRVLRWTVDGSDWGIAVSPRVMDLLKEVVTLRAYNWIPLEDSFSIKL